MSDEQEKKTPKELFLTKIYSAMQEFENVTGVEVCEIAVHRISISKAGANPISVIDRYELNLK